MFGRYRARAGFAGSLLVVLSVMILGFSGVVYVASPAGADAPHPLPPPGAASGDGIQPVVVAGNPECEDLGYPSEAKIESPATGTYAFSGFSISITVSNPMGPTFAFSSTRAFLAVIVKGGSNANVFTYPVPGDTADTALHSPLNGATYYGLSHISFCYGKSLSATKTAAGSYDRTVTWTLDKSVDDNSHTGYAGQDAGSSTWTVVADKSETRSNYRVTGSITVTNPNGSAVNFSISDTLGDGTTATVTCPGGGATGTVPAGGSVECSYSASPTDDAATKNTAVVTSLTAGVTGATAEAPITWTGRLTGYDSGTLADARFGYSATISGDATVTFPETFPCSADASLYTDGAYSYTATNTATLNGGINLSRSASVTVSCALQPLDPDKTAAGTYDRTVTWTLDKSVDDNSHTGYAGQDAGSSTWTVVADKSEALGNYQVTGSISVYNPSAIAQTFTITDVLNDGTAAAVTCPSYTAAANSSVTCSYTASPAGMTATLNTATIAMPGNPNQVVEASINWTERLVVGYDSGTLADGRFGYSAAISGDTTVTFAETFSCPAADSGLYVGGAYSYTATNTATLNGGINLSDPASVTVDCTALGSLTIIKDAVGLHAQTADFDFTTDNLTPASFPLGDSGQQDFVGLLPGRYVVTELAETGWDLTGIACVGADDSVVTVSGAELTVQLATGEDLTCTFTNTERGHIIVQKATDPSPDPSATLFQFDPSWSAENFFLANGESHDSGALVPGSYSVVEIVPAGWDLTTPVVCSDWSPASAISLQAGETVTCVFTNTLQRGQIIVDKVTDPSLHAQSFAFHGSWGGATGTDFFLTDQAAPYSSGPLLPGAYSVGEMVPPGWDLTDIACRVSAGTVLTFREVLRVPVNPSNITLGAGETVTCVFTNTLQRGHIIVQKVVDPATDPTQFQFTPSWGTGFSLGNGQSSDSGPLLPGAYSVGEAVPAGWSLDSAVCSDGSQPGAINLDPGETVTCTFNNRRLATGTLTIIKDAAPGDDTEFSYTGDLGGFTLQDPSNPSRTFAAGGQTVTVTEATLSGDWRFGGVTCTGAEYTPSGQSVTVSVPRDGTAVCTFNNYKLGHIIVDKVTDPAGDPTQFEFDPSWGANFHLTDGSPPLDSGPLQPGSYSVAEVNLPAGWSLTGAVCSDQSAPSAIVLDAGETVTCTFSDYQQRGRIIVDKVTLPGGSAQQFEFDASWAGHFFLTDATIHDSGLLLAARYSVAEVNLPAGWSLTGATCSDGSSPAAIDLDAGETVTCTFTDTQAGRIIVDKATDPAGSTQQFEFDPSWGGNFLLTDASTPADSGDLVPGTYSVAEVPLAGWSLTGAVCSDQSDPAAIVLDPGETVTCTFTNTQAGRIIVDKVTDPAGDPTQFEFEPSWGVNFFLADAGTPNDSGYLSPGRYSVAEVNLPAGWSLTGAVCSDQSDPAAISLEPGEVVTCTFNNLNPPEGSITIVKEAVPADDTVFAYSGDLGIFALTDPSDSSRTFTGLAPGEYTVTEGALSGLWKFDKVTCNATSWSEDGQSVTVDLGQGAAVVCTFENYEEQVEPPTASLTIVKDATPADDTVFNFDAGALGAFSLKDPSDPMKVFTELESGTYAVTELDLTGDWNFDHVQCTALDWSVADQTVTVNLAEGEAALCTFYNFEEGVEPPTASLTIVKDATPADDTVFNFDGGALGTFSLKDPSSPTMVFTELGAGAYTIIELDPTGGWSLADVQCTAADWSVTDHSVTVNLAEGEAALCTFYNEGELPFTGVSPYLLPMMAAGWAALALGLAMLLLARRRGTA
jgi:plastocyanin/uncharacterized cupin superfamily protein